MKLRRFNKHSHKTRERKALHGKNILFFRLETMEIAF